MENELMVVQQLPIIQQQLASVKDKLSERLEQIQKLDCTEETRAECKNLRAALTKEFNAFETRRKEIKAEIAKPYQDFEAVYKDCIANAYRAADSALSEKISYVESGIKQRKSDEIRRYFTEYSSSVGVPSELFPFDRAGVNITLSASEKALKKQCKESIDRVAADLDAIRRMDDSAEIKIEYEKTLSLPASIATVKARKVAIEKELNAQRERDEAKAAQEAHDSRVSAIKDEYDDELFPPTELPSDEQQEPVSLIPDEPPRKKYTTVFRVSAYSIEAIKELKKFLINGGYEYESIK